MITLCIKLACVCVSEFLHHTVQNIEERSYGAWVFRRKTLGKLKLGHCYQHTNQRAIYCGTGHVTLTEDQTGTTLLFQGQFLYTYQTLWIRAHCQLQISPSSLYEVPAHALMAFHLPMTVCPLELQPCNKRPFAGCETE